MRLRHFLVLAFLVSSSTPAPAQNQNGSLSGKSEISRAWSFDQSDLEPDAAVRYGVLANGMRYAILRNETPRGNASVRLHFNIGSTSEAEDQRGLAHFLEHMAFNGSKKVPEGEMVKLLERLGLKFGPDTNASTGHTETIYKLDLPSTADTHLDPALMLMRETASELLLDPKAVDRERGIIIGEKGTRNSPQLRQLEKQLNFLAPGTLPGKRLPIGLEEVIRNAPAQRLRDFYETFYTPSRATLVIVGDINPEAVEAKIKAGFSDWKAKRAPASDPVMGKIDPARPLSVGTFVEPGIPTIAFASFVRPYSPKPDTAANRATNLLESISLGIVGRRFAKLVRTSDSRIVDALLINSPYFKSAEVGNVIVVAKDGDWKTALTTGEQELRRAIQFGFTQAELNEQLANLRASLKSAVDQASTRTNRALVDQLVGGLERKAVFTTPKSNLERFEALAAKISLDQVNSTFLAIWQGANPQIMIAHSAPPTGGEAAIRDAWIASSKVAVTAPAQAEAQNFAYTSFGPAGTVADNGRIADLDVRTIRFANNVRLNIKRTDFEKGVIRVSVRVGGGMLEFPQSPDGIAQFAQFALGAGGTKAHSVDELQSLMAGKLVNIGFAADEDHFGMYASTTPADLLSQLQVLAAYTSSPGYRPEGEAQWRNIVNVAIPNLDTTPQGVSERDVARIVTNGDTREGLTSADQLKGRSYAELRPIIQDALSKGPIEIGIVGDVKEEDAIATVAGTFGALPTRVATRPDYAAKNPRRFAKVRKTVTLNHGGKPDQAMVQSWWPTPDGFDRKTGTQLGLLASVLQLRVTEELREKMGATYSPRAAAAPSTLYRGFGTMNVWALVTPERADELLTAIDGLAKDLGSKPVSADLLNRARAPMIESLQRGRRDNATWLGTIDEAQSQPADLDEFRQAEAMLKAVTAAELQGLAKRYLVAGEALRFKILPRTAK